MAKAMGATHKVAIAICQSKKKWLIAIKTVEIIEPNNSGIRW
jgi:hypothetical protein